jgi:hypothetical protein
LRLHGFESFPPPHPPLRVAWNRSIPFLISPGNARLRECREFPREFGSVGRVCSRRYWAGGWCSFVLEKQPGLCCLVSRNNQKTCHFTS